MRLRGTPKIIPIELSAAESRLRRVPFPGHATGCKIASCNSLPEDYQNAVLCTAPRVAVEAAARLGWDRWLCPSSAFIGMHGYGASARGDAVYKHFGITPEAVAAAPRALL